MTGFQRQPRHYYEDPLSRVWLTCAAQVGFRVARTADAYASSDGHGTLLIATEDQLDPDDNLGQMIFHELCHALVEGESGERALDWGLDNTRMGKPWREHACLRLQAWLAGSVGLRDFFAPTTDFRVSFWATLPADPLLAGPGVGGRRERSCVAARIGAWRASQPRWAEPLHTALTASARIAAWVPGGGASSVDSGGAGLALVYRGPATAHASRRPCADRPLSCRESLRRLRLEFRPPGPAALPARTAHRAAGSITGLHPLRVSHRAGLPDLRSLLPRGLPFSGSVVARSRQPDSSRSGPDQGHAQKTPEGG